MASILTQSLILAFVAVQATATPARRGFDKWTGYTDPDIKFQLKDKNMDYCNWSKDTTRATTAKSPLTVDCNRLIYILDNTPGDFATSNFAGAEAKDIKIVAQEGTCAFGVRPAHAEEMKDTRMTYWVGNGDARSILRWMIANWSQGFSDGTNHVGGGGRMGCETARSIFGNWRNVAWDVFDPRYGVQDGKS